MLADAISNSVSDVLGVPRSPRSRSPCRGGPRPPSRRGSSPRSLPASSTGRPRRSANRVRGRPRAPRPGLWSLRAARPGFRQPLTSSCLPPICSRRDCIPIRASFVGGLSVTLLHLDRDLCGGFRRPGRNVVDAYPRDALSDRTPNDVPPNRKPVQGFCSRSAAGMPLSRTLVEFERHRDCHLVHPISLSRGLIPAIRCKSD